MKGERIQIIGPSSDENWLWGRNSHGTTGFVPTSYVTRMASITPPSSAEEDHFVNAHEIETEHSVAVTAKEDLDDDREKEPQVQESQDLDGNDEEKIAPEVSNESAREIIAVEAPSDDLEGSIENGSTTDEGLQNEHDSVKVSAEEHY